MRRQLAVLLAAVLLLLSSGQIAADTAIIDRLNPGAYARVTHAGELVVSATSGALNIAHISSALHIAGFVPVWAYQSGAWTLAAVHQAGIWNVAHLSAVVHVSLGTQAVYVTQSGAWTIQAAHQGGAPWTVSHLSSAVHIAGTAIGGIVQTREQHVASVTHVSGGVFIRDPAIATAARVTHIGELLVNCNAGCAGGASDAVNVFHQSTVRHVSSVEHVVILDWQRWAHLAAAQSGSWTVQAAHQGGEWNVRHISAVAHVLVTESERNRLGVHVTDKICLTCSALVTHRGGISVEGFGADNTVLVATNTTPFRVAHITSVTHVLVTQSERNRLAFHRTDATCLTCTARVDHYNAAVNQPHISGAVRAWQVQSCGSTASLAVSTNTNRRDLILSNIGGAQPNAQIAMNTVIFVGFGATGHVALTSSNGFPLQLHMATGSANSVYGTAAPLRLENYQGPVACITNANSANMGVLEILR